MEMAKLYRWLAVACPVDDEPQSDNVEDEPQFDEFEEVRPAPYIERLRRDLLAGVCEAEGADGVVALRFLFEANPSDEYLKHRLHKSQRRLESGAWRAVEPAQIYQLVMSRRARLVSDEDSLLAVLRESLARYEDRLQGQTSDVETLWNEKPQIPKQEGALSNRLKVHLDHDLGAKGVIVNREVEVRPRPRGIGRRVDLHIDAVGPAPDRRRLTVIAEVKRCANVDWDDVAGQLEDRYLRAGVTHGLYVVGYFNDGCSTCRSHTIEQVVAVLHERVRGLGPGITVVPVVLDCGWPRPARRRRLE